MYSNASRSFVVLIDILFSSVLSRQQHVFFQNANLSSKMSVHYPNAGALGATDLELGPLRKSQSGFDSLRSSLDEDYYRNQSCDVHVHDNVSTDDLDDDAMAYSRHSITDPSVVSNSPDLLRNRLKVRLSPSCWL